jgi:hypothetical protein
MIDGVILQSSSNIGDFYAKYCEGKPMEDRLLVIDVFKESTFGDEKGVGFVKRCRVIPNLLDFLILVFPEAKVGNNPTPFDKPYIALKTKNYLFKNK